MSRDVNKAPRQPEVRRSRTEKPRPAKRHAQPRRETQPTDEEVEENKAEALALQLEVARLKAQVEQEAREAAKAAEAAQAAEEVELQRQELEALTRQREELRKKERSRLLEVAGKQAQKMYVRRRLPLLQARVAQWRQLTDDTKLEMKRRDVLRRWRHLNWAAARGWVGVWFEAGKVRTVRYATGGAGCAHACRREGRRRWHQRQR